MSALILTAMALLSLTVHIPLSHSDSGPKERLGRIIFTSAGTLTPEQIRELAGLSPGQLLVAQTIQDACARIRKAYFKRGFIKFKASIDKQTTLDGISKDTQIVNLRITIDEGVPFYIGKTEVEGNLRTNHHFVMRAVGGLRPDQPYNPEDVQKWVRGLNRSGRFEAVKNKDIEITVNEEDHFVDLLFHLKEKPGLRVIRK